MFRRILIANRSEIAVRISRTLNEMGITAVAVYSDPDRGALHVAAADEAYPLGGTSSAETYLRIDKIIDIARTHRIDAIHPGYGFLSENAELSQACADTGITFIGPTPDVMRAMGDKITAKKLMVDAGVPVVPGWSGGLSVGIDAMQREAGRIGFPLIIKAAAGGGGKGMRVVPSPDTLEESLAAAGREANAAFGDARVFMERCIQRPRHIEFQILGDHHGNVVHLFERECSIQRRHQKIVEETPSPALTDELRQAMSDAATKAAKAIQYTNAGTVEFMLDDAARFYFLEVNARLQVEHPITEACTGLDLVRAQIEVAAGQPLGFTQDELRQDGHAIECRIYAEDASKGFIPSVGRIEHFVPPCGPGIRIDSGVTSGSDVTVHYDPMLAKLIVHDRDRNLAAKRMAAALRRFPLLGITSNIEFLRWLIDHQRFRNGDFHTQFLDEERYELPPAHEVGDEVFIAAALTTMGVAHGAHSKHLLPESASSDTSPWQSANSWRLSRA